MADQAGKLGHREFFQLESVQAKLQWDLVRQLEKDLGISINSIDPTVILEQVKNSLHQAAKSGHLAHLLYRIDVDENKAAIVAEGDFPENLSLEVIRREARKVLFRHQYGNA